ncbi:MAG: response regulator [Candidatus Eisenbacteria bacterium]|nr:response regulator [Candidatus Eisenbacteria bacterium]
MGPDGRGRRILVVEDNPKNLKLVRDLLAYRGHAVLEASDGISGVETALRERPDLILMDIQLPGMDGIEATRRLKSDERTSSIPVLAVTAHVMRNELRKIRQAGFDGYVTKPIHTSEFLRLVEQVLRLERADAPERGERSPAEAAGGAAGLGGTILVVDDEERNRRLAEATLAPFGYRIRHAAGGEEAIEEIEKRPPDLVLLDLMMPGMDGLEVTRRLRERKETRHLPIILLTAFADADRRLKGIEAGVDDFIAKPFDRLELTTRIHSLIRISHYRTQIADYKRSEAILAGIGEGVVLLDGDWRVEIINKAASSFLDLPVENARGANLLDHLFGNRTVKADRAALVDHAREEARFEIHRPETALCALSVLEASLRRIREPGGGVSSMILTMRDVTRRWNENRLQEDFLSSVSHKLKTPLSVITANAESFLYGYYGDISEDQREAVTDVARAAQDLLSHVNKLLAFVSPESFRKDDVQPESVSLFLDTYAVNLVHEFRDREVRFETSTDPAAAEMWIPAHKVGIVLDNLVENGVKFANGDGAEIRIAARLDGADHVEFSVRDNGPGIPPEVQDRVFDKFYQVEKYHTGTVAGSGLGLSLARRIVEEMGGRIWLDSRLGGGSTFFFTAPCEPPPDETP